MAPISALATFQEYMRLRIRNIHQTGLSENKQQARELTQETSGSCQQSMVTWDHELSLNFTRHQYIIQAEISEVDEDAFLV